MRPKNCSLFAHANFLRMMSFAIEKSYCFLAVHTKYCGKLGVVACSLMVGLFWKADPTEHYQDTNETDLDNFCSLLQDALKVQEIQTFKKITGIKYRLEASSP